MRPSEFLLTLWSELSDDAYVFLPTKGARWSEGRGILLSDARSYESSDELEALLRTDRDQYFTPLGFSDDRRLNQNALPGCWLYADLDAVDPRRVGLRPTIAVQSSPGRFQAYWRLKRPLDADNLQSYNRRLTYAIGADKGGWDLSQVLRPPGTINHKYEARTTVRMVWDDGPTYTLRQVSTFLGGVEANNEALGPEAERGTLSGLVLPPLSRAEIIRKYRGRFHQRVPGLLAGELSTGEEGRSGLLWELECRLFESGLEAPEIFVVVRDSPYNKFKDRDKGDEQLWSEIQKASLHVGYSFDSSEEGVAKAGGPVRLRPRLLSYADLMGSKLVEPEWLIEDWWTLGSHGIVAGLPKSYKSLVTMDMAVSISSERDFLGRYPINPKGVGPVLIVQQENSLPLLRDRLGKISASRGLQQSEGYYKNKTTVTVTLPPAIPLHFYNDFGFDMTMVDDRDAIEEIVRKEGIKLVVFDPLYLMIGGADENSAQEMRPILSWLLRLRNLYNCAVVVVHHWGKGGVSRGGRGQGGVRLLGTTTLYGWLEAAIYLEAEATGTGFTVVAEREFRERMSPPPRAFNLKMGNIGETDYEWEDSGPAGSLNKILEVIEAEPGLTINELKERIGISQKKLRDELNQLLGNDSVEARTTEGERVKRFYIAGT